MHFCNRNVFIVVLTAALAGCAPGASMPPMASTQADTLVQDSVAVAKSDSGTGTLAQDPGAIVKPDSSTIAIRSAVVGYQVAGQKYGGILNGSCRIRHEGNKAVGCVVYFIFNVNAYVQKAAIGLYTGSNGTGCQAAISGLYKDFNVHKGEKLEIKTFYWEGC